MINPDDIKKILVKIDDSDARELAAKINQYSITYNIEQPQIIALLNKYKSTPVEELEKQTNDLRVRRDERKSILIKKIME